MKFRVLDWVPQTFSHSLVLNLKGLGCVNFETSPQKISDAYLSVWTIHLVLLSWFLWWDNGISENLIHLSEVMQLENSRMRTQTRGCWFPVQCPLYYTIIPHWGPRGISFMAGSFSLVFLPRTSKGQEDGFSQISNLKAFHFFSTVPSLRPLLLRLSNPIRQRFPTQQDE